MTSTTETLTERERVWMEAVQRKDIAALEAILAPDYVYTASGQGRWSRQRWLNTIPIYDILRFEIVEIEVRDHGAVAVVLARYRQEAIVGGAQRSGEFLITDVWVNHDGAWQVTTRSSIQVVELPAV